MLDKKNTLKNLIIKYYSFFIFAGYYVGLEIILFTGNSSLSRFYTLPVRIVFPVLVFLLFRYNGKININRNTLLLFILFIYYVVKILMSDYKAEAHFSRLWFEYILYFVIFCASTFLFFSNIDLRKHLKIIIETVLFSGFLLSLSTIYLYKEVLFTGLGRISRLKYEYGMEDIEVISPLALAYAASLNLSLLIPYYKFYSDKKKYTKIYLVLNGFLSLIIFALGSTRGALIALSLSTLYYIFSTKGSKIKNIIIFLLAIPLSMFIINFSGSDLFSRTSDSINEGDSSGRDILWKEAIEEFSANPIFGGRIEVSGIHPHNIFLEVAMSMGLLGLILFIWLIFGSIKKLTVLPSNIKMFIYLIFINAISQHLFTGAFWGSILLFFSLGLMNATVRKKT